MEDPNKHSDEKAQQANVGSQAPKETESEQSLRRAMEQFAGHKPHSVHLAPDVVERLRNIHPDVDSAIMELMNFHHHYNAPKAPHRFYYCEHDEHHVHVWPHHWDGTNRFEVMKRHDFETFRAALKLFDLEPILHLNKPIS